MSRPGVREPCDVCTRGGQRCSPRCVGGAPRAGLLAHAGRDAHRHRDTSPWSGRARRRVRAYRWRAGGRPRSAAGRARSSAEQIPLACRVRGRRPGRRGQAGRHGGAPGARQLERHARERARGTRRRLCRRRRRRASGARAPARQGDLRAAPRRQDRSRASHPQRARSPARAIRGATRRSAGGTSTPTHRDGRPPARRATRKDRQRMAVVDGGKAARTTFLRLARFDCGGPRCARTCTPGARTRSACTSASIGHPVVGDDTYGGGGGRRLVGLPPRRHFLHAAWLRLHAPGVGRASWTCARRCRPICALAGDRGATMPSVAQRPIRWSTLASTEPTTDPAA